MRKAIAAIKKIDSRAFATAVMLALLALWAVLSPEAFVNLANSVVSFALGFFHYFYAVFTGDMDGRFAGAPLPYDLLDFSQLYSPISSDLEAAKSYFFSSLRVMLNRNFLLFRLKALLSGLSLASRFLLLALTVVPVAWMWLDSYLSPNSLALGHRSKPLKAYDSIKKAVLDPSCAWVRSWLAWMKERPWVKATAALMVLYVFNGWSLAIDFVTYYITFSLDWKGSVVFKGLVSGAILLLKFVRTMGTFGMTLLAYVVFDLIRVKMATRKLYALHQKDKDFIENRLGNTVVLSGPPGTGKTMTNCAITRTKEEMNRDGLWKIMRFFWNGFPKFPWERFYEDMESRIKAGTFRNAGQIDQWFEAEEPRWREQGSSPEGFWGYDWRKEPGIFYDELHAYSVFDAVRSCAEAFFLYSSDKPLIQANYGIDAYFKREKETVIPSYSYKVYDYDYRDKSRISNLSVRFDFNAWRLKSPIGDETDPDTGMPYKYDPRDVPSTGVVEGVVASITEINKIYGNRFDEGYQQRNADGFATSISVMRHFCTINNRPFAFLIADTQKLSDTSIKIISRFENELVIAEKDAKYKTTLFLWVYTRWLQETMIALHDRFHDAYCRKRADDTLLMTLWDRLNHFVFVRYTRRRNRFWVVKEKLINIHHTSEGTSSSSDAVWYLLPKGDYADCYATDLLRKRLNLIKASKKWSWSDSGQFKDLYVSREDDHAIHSYMGGFLGDEQGDDEGKPGRK